MSLLETRNKKFNLPFVFIAGVIFLLGLAYFANYLENLSQKNITNVEVKYTGDEKRIKIQVQENATILLDGTRIDATQLEEILKIQFDGYANPVISIEVVENVSISNTINTMEIARKNNYKVILEEASK